MNIKYLKKIFFILIFFLPYSNLFATHIVGGEFNLVHVEDSTYQLSLILYFDDINGNPGALDNAITVHIFEKSTGTDRLMDTHTISLSTDTFVEFTNPSEDCSDLDQVIRTRRLTYTTNIILDPTRYIGQSGYYVIWERCCRNNTIDNLIAPGATGQTFYMEFPAVVDENGERFYNSSPSLFEPLRDFACLNNPFKINFTGVDVDNDSLVYSLSHPIAGFSTANTPIPTNANPAPYPLVDFANGFDVNDMIHGNPSLNISQTGELFVQPSETGLFVFSVKCEEFREGEKIGEVIRDYQLLVVDNCDLSPPIVSLVDTTFNSPPDAGDALFISGEPGQCIEFTIADSTDFDKLSVQINPVGFDDVNDNIAVEILTLDSLPIPNQIEISRGQELTYMVCMKDECSGINFDTEYHFQIVLGDNSCPTNLYDTTDVFINILTPKDSIPIIEIRDPVNTDVKLPFDSENGYYFTEVDVNENLEFTLFGFDENAEDDLVFTYTGVNFSLEEVGLDSLVEVVDAENEKLVNFSWTPSADCRLYGDIGTDVYLDFIVGDLWECGVSSFDTARVKIKVNFPNSSPTLEIHDKEGEELPFTTFYFDSVNIGETLSLDILGFDLDNDSIQISASGVGFELEDLEMYFNPDSLPSKGLPIDFQNNPLLFEWIAPSCDFLDNGDPKYYDILFKIDELWECGIRSSRTKRLRIKLFYEPEPNSEPVMTPIRDQNSETSEKALVYDSSSGVYRDTLIVGETWDLDINVADSDPLDYIRITSPVLANLEALGMEVTLIDGIPTESDTSNVLWTPTCEGLGVTSDNFAQLFELEFVAKDPPFCFRENASTIKIELLVKMPPNEVPLIFDLRNDEFDLLKSYDANNQTFNITINAGELISFDILGYDEDKDSVDMIVTGEGFNMENLGMRLGESFYQDDEKLFKKLPFSWQTGCEFLNGLDDAVYKLKVIIRDKQLCDLTSTNVFFIDLRVRDKPVDWDNLNFINAFTPNNDDKNQTFFLDGDKILDVTQRLPEDNCRQQFIKIEIYNRWGESVYENDDRTFEWEGKGLPAGVYFYIVYYTEHKYKGTVTLLR